MRTPQHAELLTVWERGLDQPAPVVALLLLAVAHPDESAERLAQLTIGQRDRLLLALREQLFGPRLESVVTCPACGERLELSFAVADVRTPAELHQADPPLLLETGSYRVHFRPPNSLDLLAVAESRADPDLSTRRNQLLARCLVTVERAGQLLPAPAPADLPAEVVQAILDAMARADPQAETLLALHCPACGHQWQDLFDILGFLWQEIQTWAYGLVRDVHTLALAFGWGEADILALSPWRRQLYLDLVRS